LYDKLGFVADLIKIGKKLTKAKQNTAAQWINSEGRKPLIVRVWKIEKNGS
jgi:hypothetical protein